MERINLPNGCYWQETNSRNNAGYIANAKGHTLMTNIIGIEAKAFADAMKPVYTKPHPIQCEDVWDESGVMAAQFAATDMGE